MEESPVVVVEELEERVFAHLNSITAKGEKESALGKNIYEPRMDADGPVMAPRLGATSGEPIYKSKDSEERTRLNPQHCSIIANRLLDVII
jgi:hypothetical protein